VIHLRLEQLTKLDERGQAEAVNVQLTLIISLVVAIIVIYQLFISGAGPTTHPYIHDNEDNTTTYGVACDAGDIDNIDNTDSWRNNPYYDAAALGAFNNVVTLSWAGIGLMAVAIIILAASVILGVVRGFGGGRV